VTGSSYIPIVVPIVAFLAMAFWLGLVFYADQHPGYRRRTPQRSSRAATATSEVATSVPGQPHEAVASPRVPTDPREHERIDEPAASSVVS
jgi:hypothetical protein